MILKRLRHSIDKFVYLTFAFIIFLLVSCSLIVYFLPADSISVLMLLCITVVFCFVQSRAISKRIYDFIEIRTHELDKANSLHEQAELKFKSILESSPDGILAITEDGTITLYNKVCEEVFGYKQEEVIGNSIALLMFPYDSKHFHEYIATFERLHQSELKVEREVIAKHKNGNSLPLFLSVAKVDVNDEHNIIAVVRDISEQKRTEQEYIVARNEAEKANQSKSDFISTMSHEIRTPLNGIIGISELLKISELPKEQQEYVDILQISSTSLLNVINDILDFSNIESNRIILDNHAFSIRKTLDNLLDLFALQAEEKGLSLSANLTTMSNGLVTGDEARLKQVFTNLIANAIKFTTSGMISINGSIRSEEADYIEFKFVVRDTGIGIPIEQQEHIFQPFYQVDSSISRNYGGTGLGLAICKRLVRLYDGDISFDSVREKGTSFEFTAKLKKQIDYSTNEIINLDLSNQEIIIYFECENNLNLVSEKLQQLKAKPTIETNNDTFYQNLLTGKYHNANLIIVDIDIAYLEELKQELPKFNGTKFLLYTSKIEIMEIKKHLDFANVNILTKPIKYYQLMSELKRLFQENSVDIENGSHI